MNTDLALFLMLLIGLLFGYIPAAVIYGRRYYTLIKQMRYEYEDGYNAGQDQALQDPELVRKAYVYHFQTR
jgi:hypothetical protein